MANYLKMEKIETVLVLLRLGWNYRRIERETGVRRETISKYHRGLQSKAAKVPTGVVQIRQKCPPAQRSLCDGFRETIEGKLQQGLDARRIHQDLVYEHGFSGGYDSVKRFCRRLKKSQREVYARIEVAPGSQMQVDFGRGAPTLDPISGKYRKPHLFQAVLSFSRHSYEEVVWRQNLETLRHPHWEFAPLLHTRKVVALNAPILQWLPKQVCCGYRILDREIYAHPADGRHGMGSIANTQQARPAPLSQPVDTHR